MFIVQLLCHREPGSMIFSPKVFLTFQHSFSLQNQKRKVQAFKVSATEDHGWTVTEGGGGNAGVRKWSCLWDVKQHLPPAPSHTSGTATMAGTLRRMELQIQLQGGKHSHAAPSHSLTPAFGIFSNKMNQA